MLLVRNCLPGILLLVFSANVSAADAQPEPLPEPLTLDVVLTINLEAHPELSRQRAQSALAEAQRMQAASSDDVMLDLGLEARWSEPSDLAVYDGTNDSRATLVLDKTLYDFGRTGHAVEAGDALILAEEKLLELKQHEQKMAVMSDYFDVILSDLTYATENEAMASAFVTFDRARDRNELGEVSEIDLITIESAYQEQLIKRMRAAAEQRHSRERLALSLNRPGELSSDVLRPVLPGNLNPIPDYKELLAEAEKSNPGLIALKHQLEALQKQRRAVRAERNPRLYLHMEAVEYERETASRDPYYAALGLDVPLYRGQRTRADTAAEEARIESLRADVNARRFALRRELLEAWQAVNTLLLQREQATIRSDFRDQYLDRSRAEYELEIKTDLGDAMTQQTAAELYSMQTDFDLALARERLVLLTGNSSYSSLAPAKPESAEEKQE